MLLQFLLVLLLLLLWAWTESWIWPIICTSDRWLFVLFHACYSPGNPFVPMKSRSPSMSVFWFTLNLGMLSTISVFFQDARFSHFRMLCLPYSFDMWHTCYGLLLLTCFVGIFMFVWSLSCASRKHLDSATLIVLLQEGKTVMRKS